MSATTREQPSGARPAPGAALPGAAPSGSGGSRGSGARARSRRKRWAKRALLVWLALLVPSTLVARWNEPRARAGEGERLVALPVVEQEARLARETHLVVREFEPARPADAPPFLLLHGSPGSRHDFAALGPLLAERHRVLAPDFAGFGDSRERVPDYGVAAQARYQLALLDALGLERVHVVGFSFGGAVGIALAELAPERVASLTLLSAMGVQELELFGSRDLNRLVHGLQLGCLRVALVALPHFGALERSFLGLGYARSFYDTDQRPLREDLLRYQGPLLVLHGEEDLLVPVAAAREHARLVPQSRLVVEPARGHFLLWQEPEHVAAEILAQAEAAEAGRARTRAEAEPARIAAALEPFDPARVPPWSGMPLWILLGLAVLATWVSEDLTCIGIGLLAADGRIGFVPGTLACLVGIFSGDLLVYGAGRLLGRPAVERIPLRWLISPAAVERGQRWFAKHGAKAVLVSRLLPGARLATYFVAGLSRAPFWAFCLYFLIGGLVWTPVLVGASMAIGSRFRSSFEAFEQHALLGLVAVALTLVLVQRLVVPACTRRGRRRLLGSWRRLRHWEFWPPWALYGPVVVHVVRLALRHRSLRLVTAANPAIPTGGLVGESKSAILAALGDDPRVARHVLVREADEPDERVRAARAFLSERSLALPVVLKPDVGQRGSGVVVVRSEEELERRLREARVDLVVQEFVDGPEYGVFYARRPGEARGRLLSVAHKARPEVVGDGRTTLEDLILFDERAVCMARVFCERHAERLADVPAAGERVVLTELGTHCRGAVFLDAHELATPALLDSIESVSRRFSGFFFGRYDLRARSPEHLARGEGFQIVELNGLASECAHIYDPAHGLRDALRTLKEQWRLAFDIAAENAALGARPTRVRDVLRAALAYEKLQRLHPR